MTNSYLGRICFTSHWPHYKPVSLFPDDNLRKHFQLINEMVNVATTLTPPGIVDPSLIIFNIF